MTTGHTLHPTTRMITLIVLFASSLASVYLASLRGAGLLFCSAGLLFNIGFAYFYWMGKSWAKGWLLARYVVTLLFAGFLLLSYGDLLGAMFESLVSLCMIWLLLGWASPARAVTGLGGFVLILVVLVAVVIQASRGSHVASIVRDANTPALYESPHKYQLALSGMPWKVLTSEQATQVLGQEIRDADLQLIRNDGSSFGLIFPLRFQNTPLNDQLSMMLEMEIRERWLSNLYGWQRIDSPDGFVLTAHGRVEQTPVSYVIFYKHFGNLGLYGVFWSEAANQERLLSETEALYAALEAPPVKERLDTFSPAQIYAANGEAVVLVNLYDGEDNLVARGTGFNLAPEGLIVTNLHVLLEGERIEVIFPNRGVQGEPLVLGLSAPQTDLALLALSSHDLPVIRTFRSVPVAPGDLVYVIGNPKGLVNSVSQGIIGGVREEGDVLLYQITAPISDGSSGGPVFNEFGEVIGVANSVVVGAQNLNFSVSVDELVNLYIFEEPIPLKMLITELNAL